MCTGSSCCANKSCQLRPSKLESEIISQKYNLFKAYNESRSDDVLPKLDDGTVSANVDFALPNVRKAQLSEAEMITPPPSLLGIIREDGIIDGTTRQNDLVFEIHDLLKKRNFKGAAFLLKQMGEEFDPKDLVKEQDDKDKINNKKKDDDPDMDGLKKAVEKLTKTINNLGAQAPQAPQAPIVGANAPAAPGMPPPQNIAPKRANSWSTSSSLSSRPSIAPTVVAPSSSMSPGFSSSPTGSVATTVPGNLSSLLYNASSSGPASSSSGPTPGTIPASVMNYTSGIYNVKELRSLVDDLIAVMPSLRRPGGPFEKIPTSKSKKVIVQDAVEKAMKEFHAAQANLSANKYAQPGVSYLGTMGSAPATPVKPRYGSPSLQAHLATPRPMSVWSGGAPATALFTRTRSASPAGVSPPGTPKPLPQLGTGTGGLGPPATPHSAKWGLQGGEGNRTALGLFRNPKRDDSAYQKFGERLIINTQKLKQGILSVIRPSGLKVSNLPNQALTPGLRECFKDFLDGEPMNTHNLSEKESEYLKHVFTEARLGKVEPEDLKIGQKAYVTKQNMRDKLMILMGQINGGNDNPKLLKQLSSMVIKLSAKGWLTDEQRLLLKSFL